MHAEFGPGTYFLGDLCYVMKDNIYKEMWGKKHQYEEGCFKASVRGEESFAVSGTAYGDGEYYDSQGRSYPVDAGVIGIVPIGLWKKDATEIEARELGVVLQIKNHLILDAENGIFTIDADGEKIIIDTKNELDDDEDLDEAFDDEDPDEDDEDDFLEDDFEDDEDLDDEEEDLLFDGNVAVAGGEWVRG